MVAVLKVTSRVVNGSGGSVIEAIEITYVAINYYHYLLRVRVDVWIIVGRPLPLVLSTYTAIVYMVRGTREEIVVEVAMAGRIMFSTKSSPFITSICTPVLGFDSLNRYVQLREMVVVVLEVMSRLDNFSGSSVDEAIERK